MTTLIKMDQTGPIENHKKEQVNENFEQEDANGKSKLTNFQKYAENNSVGGLQYVLLSSSKIRRLVWLVIILVSVAVSLYLVRNSFSKLINPPTSTTISFIPKHTLEFPAVSICETSALSSELLDDESIPIDKVRELFINETDDCEMIDEDINLDIVNVVEEDPDYSIFSCSLGELACDPYEDFYFSFNELHSCYTFNSDFGKLSLSKVNGTGAHQGLEFFIEFDNVASLRNDVGVKILLHSPGEIPHPSRFGIAVSPETVTYISFRKKVIDDQTETDCVSKDEYDWKYLTKDKDYSYNNCLEDVITDKLISECNCTLTSYYLSDEQKYNYNLCQLNDICCYRQQHFKLPNKQCLYLCKRDVFEIVSTSHTQLQYSGQSLVYVYYENLYVETQTTVFTYGIEEFFAEVGGQLGLFIGVSVITFFEFVIFIFDEIKDRCIKPRLKKRR